MYILHVLCVSLLLSPPPMKTGGNDWNGWELKCLSLDEARAVCKLTKSDIPFVVTSAPQGWLSSVYRNETRVLMHFVQEGDNALIRSFVSVEEDVDAVEPTMKLIKENEILGIDWKHLSNQPKWKLCALYYLSD